MPSRCFSIVSAMPCILVAAHSSSALAACSRPARCVCLGPPVRYKSTACFRIWAIKMLLLRSYMQDCPTSLVFFSGAFLFAYSEVVIHKAGLHRSTMFCGYYIFLNVSFVIVHTYSSGGRTKHFFQLSLLFIHDRFRQTVQRHAFLSAAFAFVLYARPIAGHKQQHLPINAIVIQSSRALRQV